MKIDVMVEDCIKQHYYSFTVPGEPRGKARPRFAWKGGKGLVYKDEKTRKYERLIANAFINEYPDFTPRKEPVELKIVVFSSPPKTKKVDLTHWTQKPDLVNVASAVCDALNKVAYDDDKQVVSLKVFKCYSNNPRLEVALNPEFYVWHEDEK